MTTIDILVIGFIANLVILPFLAIRYDLLKVRTTLQTNFSTKKVNEFIIINILFSAVSYITDILLLVHMCHRKYMQYLTEKYGAAQAGASQTDIPQIVDTYDLTGTSKKRRH